MSLSSVAAMVNAEAAGQSFFSAWRKTPSQATGAGIWFDLNMSPGNPVPNYYAASPNISVPLAQSTDGGIPHGGSVAQLGHRKFLKTFMAMTQTAAAVPLPMVLCDYLLYYPFVDMSVTDEQVMTTNVGLPRSTTGLNVQMMAVEVAGQSGVGNPQFFVTYTNSDGVSGRNTPVLACNTQTVNGTLISTSAALAKSAGPFLPLQPGDKGVRKIDSVTFLSADIGLVAFVLVEPIASIAVRTIDAPAEKSYFTDSANMPVIEDDAYLNLVCCPQGSLANAPIHGTIETIWG